MKKNVFLIIFIVSLISLNGSGLSIKLQKNLIINGEGDNYLIAQLNSADIDEKGNIYIVDFKQNSILKFNKNGKFLKKHGRKGEGPGEFATNPSFIDYSGGKIYIGLHYDVFKGILVFNTDLKFLNGISYNKMIITFYVHNKHLYISNLLNKKAFTFDVLGDSGNYIHDRSFDTTKFTTIYENRKELIIDKKGDIYTISTNEDKIEKWNRKHIKIWSKYLFSGQKIKLSKHKGPGGRSLLPLKTFWYNKIAMDSAENIYILGGNIAKYKKKDVYVISKTGKLLTIFTLPHKSLDVFRIDKNDNLYIDDFYNEEVGLIRYKLHFDSKKIKLNPKGYPAIKKGGMFYEYINAQK